MVTAAPAPPRTPMPHPVRAWTALVLGTLAQTAATVFVTTPAFLIPLLHTQRGLTLAEAGLLASAPTLGVVFTLIAWGALADRVGEKWVIVAGLALTSAAAVGAMLVDGYLALGALFLLGGMAGAATNAASGRVVVGWFPKSRRGLAMGVRQMAIPLGMTVAALTVPSAAQSGIPVALAVPLASTTVLAIECATGLANPPRATTIVGGIPPTAENPYRASTFLWRIHAVSALLVIPQITLAVFGLVWLVTELGWNPLAAGALIGASQFVGALGRIGIGVVSDRVRSRVGPLRWISLAAIAVMLLLAAFDALHWGAAAAITLVIATTVTVADNGLAYTSVAEVAGPRWAGRALGAQNTGQYLAGSAVGPVLGALITAVGYPLAFLTVAVAPLIATPLIPRRREERDRL
jgi:MFS family permease